MKQPTTPGQIVKDAYLVPLGGVNALLLHFVVGLQSPAPSEPVRIDQPIHEFAPANAPTQA